MEETDFMTKTKESIVLINKASVLLRQIKDYSELKDERSFEYALLYERLTEKICNLARLLPQSTGVLNASEIVRDQINQESGIVIKYTDEGWFYVKMPFLLPKKEKGNVKYIRTMLYYALEKFWMNNPRATNIFDKYLIIFQHNYSGNERKMRDHDNIEVNAVIDLVTLRDAVDDGGKYCDHYYFSTAGEEDNTEVYLVPRTEFVRWYYQYRV